MGNITESMLTLRKTKAFLLAFSSQKYVKSRGVMKKLLH